MVVVRELVIVVVIVVVVVVVVGGSSTSANLPSTVAGHRAFLTISLKYRWISSSLALGGIPPA